MTNPLFVAGANATKHAFFRTISVLCVLAVCAGLYFAVHRLFNPPSTQSYAQQAESITNYEYNYYKPKLTFGIGVELWGFKLGLYKEAREDKRIERTIPEK